MTKYGVIVGSIRKNSYSLGVAEALVAGLPADAEVTYFDIASLPLYNQDLDANSPNEMTTRKSAGRHFLFDLIISHKGLIAVMIINNN